jgi:dimethylamine monooxygenase subunit A
LFSSAEAKTPLDSCWFRSEHQAFRRLSASGSILFAIRLDLVPLTALAADRTLAQRLAEALRTMPAEIAAYKGLTTARLPLAERLLAAQKT